MHDEPIPAAEPVNLDVHHEQSDIDVRAILWFIVIFIAFAVVAHVGLYFHFAALRRSMQDPNLLPVSQVRGQAARIPPEPRLQPFPVPAGPGEDLSPLATNPQQDMGAMNAEQDERLSSWGWVDQGAGTVRMPIERAMELQLQRGLPVSAPALPETAPEPVALPDGAQPAEGSRQ